MDVIDKKALEAALTKDLCVIMEGESAIAFRGKAWDGQKWPERKRDDGIGSLLIRQSKLWRGLRFQIRDNRIFIVSDTPYARIHNEGGTIPVLSIMIFRTEAPTLSYTLGIGIGERQSSQLELMPSTCLLTTVGA